MSARALAAVALLGAALAGCTPTPPPPQASEADLVRTVAIPPAEAPARLVAAAGGLGLVAAPDGSVEGPARAGSATCPRITTRMMGGETAQRRDAKLLATRVRIVPAYAPADGGTRITLQPVYTGRMLDALNYREFTVRCAPTGVFERALLDAVAAGG